MGKLRHRVVTQLAQSDTVGEPRFGSKQSDRSLLLRSPRQVGEKPGDVALGLLTESEGRVSYVPDS